MKNNYLRQAWLVIVLALCFGAVLAGVQISLQPRIDQNKLNETYEQIPELVRIRDDAHRTCRFPDKNRTRELLTDDGKIAYKAFSADGEHLGWVIKAAGQGFADRIELLIGLDAEAEIITGLYVLDQKETPALGSRITSPEWCSQFAGLTAAKPVLLTKAGPEAGRNDIKAITGATVSSRSVCEIVNAAVAEFRQRLPELKEKE